MFDVWCLFGQRLVDNKRSLLDPNHSYVCGAQEYPHSTPSTAPPELLMRSRWRSRRRGSNWPTNYSRREETMNNNRNLTENFENNIFFFSQLKRKGANWSKLPSYVTVVEKECAIFRCYKWVSYALGCCAKVFMILLVDYDRLVFGFSVMSMNAVTGIWQFNWHTRHEIAEIIIASFINLQIMIEKVELLWLLIRLRCECTLRQRDKFWTIFRILSTYGTLDA